MSLGARRAAAQAGGSGRPVAPPSRRERGGIRGRQQALALFAAPRYSDASTTRETLERANFIRTPFSSSTRRTTESAPSSTDTTTP